MLFGDKINFFMSELSKFKVEDSNGKNLGTVGDALFQFSQGKVKFHSFILFGNVLEEKLEDMGLKENIDPIISFENIEKVDLSKGVFNLNISKNEVKTTNKKWKPPKDTVHYLQLKKIPVLDKKGNKIGRVIDIYFLNDGSFKFILGGLWLEEFLERVRVYADRDLILPGSTITELTNKKIKTNISEIDLTTTLMKDIKNMNYYPDTALKPSGYLSFPPNSVFDYYRYSHSMVLQKENQK